MQIEIIKTKQNNTEYQGKTTKRIEIETSEGIFNITEKNNAYNFVPVGFTGQADVEFSVRNGRKYISRFKPLKSNGGTPPSQSTEKSHQQANKGLNGCFKKDPEGIKLEIWKRKHTSWIGCLNNAVVSYKDIKDMASEDFIKVTNDFYDALCEKIDNKKAEEADNTVSDMSKENEPTSDIDDWS